MTSVRRPMMSDLRHDRPSVLPLVSLLCAGWLLGSCGPDLPEGSSEVVEPTLDEIRAAVERYRDVEAAIADGYRRDPLDTCETAAHMGQPADVGAMGIHYLHLERLGIEEGQTRLDVSGTHTDFLEPAVLVYEPQEDDSLELVAVENLVLADAWEAASHRVPPSLHGVPFEFTANDPSRVIRAHFDRHIWLFRENPDGVFAQYNRQVTCEHHVLEMPMIMFMDSEDDTTHH